MRSSGSRSCTEICSSVVMKLLFVWSLATFGLNQGVCRVFLCHNRTSEALNPDALNYPKPQTLNPIPQLEHRSTQDVSRILPELKVADLNFNIGFRV